MIKVKSLINLLKIINVIFTGVPDSVSGIVFSLRRKNKNNM